MEKKDSQSVMVKRIGNENIVIAADMDRGIIEELRFSGDEHRMNWLISPSTLSRYGYEDSSSCLLGKSRLKIDGIDIDTGSMEPRSAEAGEDGAAFLYATEKVEIAHIFTVRDSRFEWNIRVRNLLDSPISLQSLIHWLPVAYIMHETIEENLNHSCSFVPSIADDHSHIICKKRNGLGPDLLILNTGGGMNSVGSLCRYRNLFFEKSAPSLSGLILYNIVNSYHCEDHAGDAAAEWQYGKMANPIVLQPGQTFSDSYAFISIKPSELNAAKKKAGIPDIDYPSVVLCNRIMKLGIDYGSPCCRYQVLGGTSGGEVLESEKTLVGRSGNIHIGPFSTPGERKVVLHFADGTRTFIIFAVYNDLREIVESFCSSIFNGKFIDDPGSPDYCAYTSVSRQGESCSKGSLLLLKNLLTPTVEEEVLQVERNTVVYLRKRWLDDNFVAKKQYPGGFARILDMDYLILQFFLLSEFGNGCLRLHDSGTYLLWAYRTAVYRFTVTPDKLPREVFETKVGMIFSWILPDLISRLREKGFAAEADNLNELRAGHVEIQASKVRDGTFIETEHYFDNAGFSVVAENLINGGDTENGLIAARLLLPNIAESNDYRAIAPDRWWESLAFMYHNLWAVLTAKAMLTAYSASRDTRYLFGAYRSMMPMFFNYDWNAVSTMRKLEKGEGVSAYCLTSPNLNLEYASRNRFGQSIFTDDFFSGIDVGGDDWDLGADMIVYLLTFGRKTYLTGKPGETVCVNGKYTESRNEIHIESFAAYPREYYIEFTDLTIRLVSRSSLLKWIVLRNGECVKAGVEVLGEGVPSEIELCCRKGSVETRIFPEIFRIGRTGKEGIQ